MKLTAIFATMLLVACSSHVEDAGKCGVTEDQLRQAIDEVSRMSPYSGKDIGRCELIVDDGENVHVITPEIIRTVESMIAREAAETKD